MTFGIVEQFWEYLNETKVLPNKISFSMSFELLVNFITIIYFNFRYFKAVLGHFERFWRNKKCLQYTLFR